MRIAALLAVALAAGPAYAAGENFVLVTTTDDGTIIYADHDSFQRTGSVVIVTERRDNSGNASNDYADVRMTSAYDCRKRTVQIRSATATLKSGGTPESFDIGPTAPTDPIRPGSVGEAVLDHVCAASAN
jgi:hypothetical protein